MEHTKRTIENYIKAKELSLLKWNFTRYNTNIMDIFQEFPDELREQLEKYISGCPLCSLFRNIGCYECPVFENNKSCYWDGNKYGVWLKVKTKKQRQKAADEIILSIENWDISDVMIVNIQE